MFKGWKLPLAHPKARRCPEAQSRVPSVRGRLENDSDIWGNPGWMAHGFTPPVNQQSYGKEMKAMIYLFRMVFHSKLLNYQKCMLEALAVKGHVFPPSKKKTKYSKYLYPRLVMVWYHRWHSTGIPHLLAQCRRCDCIYLVVVDKVPTWFMMQMDQVWRTMTGSSRSLIPKLWWCQGCQWWSSSHFVVQMVPKFGFFNDASPSIYTTVSKIIQDVLGHSI